jgi:hypothetical protein
MVTHSNSLISWSALAVALAGGFATTRTASYENAALEGAWRTIEVIVTSPAPQTYKPGATLAIFHGHHYSRVEEHAEQPRPLLANPATASADELRATWGPFVAEAGTFELSAGNTVALQPTVAKNPAAMAKGARSVYTFKRDGDVLTLTQVRTPAGPSPNALTVKLVRVE